MKKRMISIILLIAMTVTMLPATIFAAKSFADVSESDWFYESATYVSENEIFKGTDENLFSPSGTMTRAMFVTVLGRMAKVDIPKYTGSGNFTDVPSDAYYAPYVSWAVGQNITQGMGDGKFDPDGLVTREQMATFTCRFFAAGLYTYPANIITTTPLDIESISPYARESVLKLWTCALFQGDENGNFNPTNNATRAEAATFCMRLDQVIKSKGANSIRNNHGGSNKDPKPTAIPSYQITYDTDGGMPLKPVSFQKGTTLSNLAIPYKQGFIFEGWYYDKVLENKVLSSDVLNKPITLYAKYGKSAPVEEVASS
ncbi:MAG: S-layer homology domain-containing protein, partial [Oscillospiraceae bacterium]